MAKTGAPRRDPETSPLSGREAPEPGVRTKLLAVGIDDRPFFGLEPVPSEEGAVVVTAEEARFWLSERRAARSPARAASA